MSRKVVGDVTYARGCSTLGKPKFSNVRVCMVAATGPVSEAELQKTNWLPLMGKTETSPGIPRLPSAGAQSLLALTATPCAQASSTWGCAPSSTTS